MIKKLFRVQFSHWAQPALPQSAQQDPAAESVLPKKEKLALLPCDLGFRRVLPGSFLLSVRLNPLCCPLGGPLRLSPKSLSKPLPFVLIANSCCPISGPLSGPLLLCPKEPSERPLLVVCIANLSSLFCGGQFLLTTFSMCVSNRIPNFFVCVLVMEYHRYVTCFQVVCTFQKLILVTFPQILIFEEEKTSI